MNRKLPGTLNIYKKSGAVQFTLIPPRWSNPVEDKSLRLDKNGSILLEVAKGLGEKSYAWEEKINIALGINDIMIIFDNPDRPAKLIHDTPNSPLMKTLEFVPGEEKYKGTYMMKLSETNQETNASRFLQVPLSGGEYFVLQKLLLDMLPKMVGWVE